MGLKIVLSAIVVVAAVVGGSYLYTKATQETLVTTITKTDRECKSNSDGSTDCRYVVYTPEEVFENVDSWWYFKFNSSDFNNKLTQGIGKKFKLTIYGIRVPFMSWYRNIVDYEIVE